MTEETANAHYADRLAAFCEKCLHRDCISCNGCDEYRAYINTLDPVGNHHPARFGRKKVLYEIRGESLTLKEIAAKYGINYETLQKRVHDGMSAEEAVNKPTKQGGSAKKRVEYHGQMLTFDEIAEITGLKANTIKNRHYQGIPFDAPFQTRRRRGERRP